jgi:hypothetical protein
LNSQSPGACFGRPKGSVGVQYSTKPDVSAEITQSYLSVY